ncbi:MAG: hypothetical protein AAGF29_08575 [Pseudomonadota bacterium]
MPQVILADHHDQVYTYWREHGARGLSVAHVDSHCDMRGLLIDRPKQRASFTSHRESTFVDRGNFMSHAIMEGMVTKLTWIHNAQSGRGYDHGPVVSYESDAMAPLYRYRHKRSGREDVALTYHECLFEDWKGLAQGEQLDLDWDALASVEFSNELQNQMIAGFLEIDLKHTPDVTFLIYSPGYSNPDRSLYEDFGKELASKFKAEIVRLPEQDLVTDGERFSAVRGVVKKLIPPQVMATKRAVNRWARLRATANDLDVSSAA